MLLGEVDDLDDHIIDYYGNETHSGITPLNTVLITKLNDTSDAEDIKEVIENWLESIPEGVDTNWIVSKNYYVITFKFFNDRLTENFYCKFSYPIKNIQEHHQDST